MKPVLAYLQKIFMGMLRPRTNAKQGWGKLFQAAKIINVALKEKEKRERKEGRFKKKKKRQGRCYFSRVPSSAVFF